MKNLSLFLIICFAFLAAGFGQEVMLSKDTLGRSKGKEKYKYQSINQYDQQLLFKLGTAHGLRGALGDDSYNIPFDLLAAEYKLTDRVSVEGSYFFPSRDLSAFSFRVRRYLKKETLANNLSGKYLAIEYTNVSDNSQTFDSYLGRDQAVFLQVGNQIKSTRFGYADFRLFGSYQFGELANSFNLGLNVSLGLAWGPLGKRADASTAVPFSFKRERTLITFESPTFAIGTLFDLIEVTTSVERELFVKGLTSRTEFSAAYSEQNAPGISISSTSVSISEEVRKYFALLKKPSADLPLHSFSGIYTGIGINDLFISQKISVRQTDGESYDRNFNGGDRSIAFLSLGYQERMGKRYFFDIFARYSFTSLASFTKNIRGPSWISYGTRVGFNWGW